MRYSQEELHKNLISKEREEHLAELEAKKGAYRKWEANYYTGAPIPTEARDYIKNQEKIDAQIMCLQTAKVSELFRRMSENEFWDKVDKDSIKNKANLEESKRWLEEDKKRRLALEGARGLQNSPQGSPDSVQIKGKRVKKLVGYAARFNSPTYVDGYYEVVLPGAFTKSLRTQEVFCLWHHIQDQILGRTSSGTLKVWEDSKGLRFECLTPDTQIGQDVVTLVERGDVRGCSFSFGVRRDDPTSVDIKYDKTLQAAVRYIKDVNLYEVTVTAYPAYLSTEVHVE